MPRSIDVDDFTAKLVLLTKRLNWSRAQLAREVGVDKSLAARWLAGDTHPSGNSFMRLNATAAQTLPGFIASDWDLPIDQFARRLGIAQGTQSVSSEAATPLRTTLDGLHHPHKAEWGKPYLGLWAGFFNSLSNWGRPLFCVTRFNVDELGLRFAWSVGNFSGEGPALATHSFIHCFLEVQPLYDKVYMFVFNAVHDPDAAVMDGLICGVGTDGAPAAAPILLLHVGEEADDAPTFETIRAAAGQIYEHAASEAARTGDPFAVVRELAPDDVLRLVCPTVGVPRQDGTLDHVLRAPTKRSLGMGRMTLNSLPANEPLRIVRANLRRALGFDEPPKVRLARTSAS